MVAALSALLNAGRLTRSPASFKNRAGQSDPVSSFTRFMNVMTFSRWSFSSGVMCRVLVEPCVLVSEIAPVMASLVL